MQTQAFGICPVTTDVMLNLEKFEHNREGSVMNTDGLADVYSYFFISF